MLIMILYQGTTRLLLTKIPMFREVILMSFLCSHCGFRNSEIQPGTPIQDLGVRYSFKVKTKEVGKLLLFNKCSDHINWSLESQSHGCEVRLSSSDNSGIKF